MSDVLTDILQTCLMRLEAGATVEDCLAAYPQQAGDIEGPLRAAVLLRGLPRPAMPAATRAALNTQMVALAAARRAAPGQIPMTPTSSPWRTMNWAALLAGVLRALGYRGPLSQPWLRGAAVAVALLLAVILGVGAVSAARAIINLVAPQQPASVPFTLSGPIEQIAPDAWIVNGATITIDENTTISGTPAVGALAQVEGVLDQDGTLRARSINVGQAAIPTATASATPSATPAATPSPPPLPTVAPPPPPTLTPVPPPPPPTLTPVPPPPPPAPPAPEPPSNGDDDDDDDDDDDGDDGDD